MWNGHRMLRHRGHRDELTADLLSKRRDNYPGNFICLPRFLPPSSKYFQSLLDDRLSSSFCFLFVPPSRFFSRLSWLDANILLPILRLSNFRIGFFRFFFFFFFFLPLFFFFLLLVASSSMIILGRRGNRIVRLTTTFFDTRVFCGE